MTLLVVGMIAASSLAWSVFDMSRKKIAERLSPVPVVVWLMLLQTPLFAMVSMVEIWRAPAPDYWYPAIGSILLNCFANVLFIMSVSWTPLSLAIPVLSLTPVFTAGGAFLLLGEPTSMRQAVGIAVIVTTTFALGRGETALEIKEEERSQVRKGMIFMGIVAFLWATTPVLDKICLQYVPSSQHAFIQCLGVAGILAVGLRIRRDVAPMSHVLGSARWFVLAAVAAAIALGTQLWSIQYVPVGIFEALKRSIGLIAALIFGFLIFREPVTRLKAWLVVLMGLGIFILLI